MNNEEKLLQKKIEKARKFGLEKQFDNAIKNYLAVIEELDDSEPGKFILEIELGWCYYNNQNYSQAIIQFETLLKNKDLIQPQQQFDCLRLIGFSHSMLGNRDEAIYVLKKSLNINILEKTKRFVYFELGKLLLDQGQVLEAENFLKKADALFEKNETNYKFSLTYYFGFIAYLNKNISLASKMFEKIIKQSKDPKTRASGFFGLAHIHYFNKDYATLIDICEKILRLDQSFFDKETLGFFMCSAYSKLKLWNQLEIFFSELESNYPQGRYSKEYAQFRNMIQKNIP
jgi:tetratricopeptide (TPR) repeat protein